MNILCLVRHFSSDTEQHKLGTRHSTFLRNQFMLSTFHGLSEAEVNSKTEISVREAARLQSLGDGQDFVKCSWKTGCARITCKGVRSNVLCDSRCQNK